MDDSQLLCYLIRLNRRRICFLRQALAPHQYVGVMHLLMLYLSNHPGASQDAIREHFALDKTSVARDARRLEELGHIHRRIDESNRRQYQMFLTPQGEAFLPTIRAAYDAFSERLTSRMPPEKLETLISLLRQLDENTSKMP